MKQIFTSLNFKTMKWNFMVLPLAICTFGTLKAQTTNTFCVQELFTSEGCSSCPSGENVLNSAVNATDNTTTNNLYIALHVELWNYLGWTDPYSNSQYDDMFFGYDNSGVGITYASGNQFGTPLFVRNGLEGRNFSAPISAKQATAWVDLSFNELVGDQLKVNYALTGDLANTEARFFLVERGLVNHVTAGENAGATLHHENAARDMKILATTTANGTVTFTVPSNANIENMCVMAYIRKNISSPWSREIVGANKGFKVGQFVGLNELNQEAFETSVYPNPAKEQTTILCVEPMQQITVTNEMGEVVITANPNSNQSIVDVSSFSKGLYFVKIETDKGVVMKKVIKN